MTVAEVIEELKKQDQTLEVRVGDPFESGSKPITNIMLDSMTDDSGEKQFVFIAGWL